MYAIELERSNRSNCCDRNWARVVGLFGRLNVDTPATGNTCETDECIASNTCNCNSCDTSSIAYGIHPFQGSC
jgi:hypothetical protein